MNFSRTTAVLATTVALAVVTTAPAAAQKPSDRGGPTATVTVPDSVVEGDRFTVEVKVRRTQGATRILLQRFTTDILGNTSWETVKRAKVAGKRKHTFGAVAAEDDAERYRARVLYDDRKPAMSKPDTATVWHWGSMMQFTAYSYTHGVASNSYNQFRMNGTEYRGGWYTYGAYATWDLRFTPGRHCKAYRGVVGLTDDSADGSSGALQLVADDTTVYSSPTMTPGMSVPFQVELATPYRLFIQAQRTSPADQRAYPAIGNPELLCTGLQ